MNAKETLAKIGALRDGATTEGERNAAEKAYQKIIDKYGIDASEIEAEEQPQMYTISYRTTREKRLLTQIVVSVLTLEKAEGYYRRHGLAFKATGVQYVEIEYLFDFYRRLYRDEEELLFQAFLHKHSIFPPDGKQIDDNDIDHEQLKRLLGMMQNLSDETARKQLTAAHLESW